MIARSRHLLIVLCMLIVGMRVVGTQVHLHDDHDQTGGQHGHVIVAMTHDHAGGHADHPGADESAEHGESLVELALRAFDNAEADPLWLLPLLIAMLLAASAPSGRLHPDDRSHPHPDPFRLRPPSQAPPRLPRLT